jgi:hypothetical protein
MHKVYRHKLDSAETSVDAADEFVYSCAQILVFLDILSRWHSELCEDDLSNPFWMLSEEELECVELLGNALDVIESIDTDDDLNAIEALLKCSDTFLNRFFLQILRVQSLVSLHEGKKEAERNAPS